MNYMSKLPINKLISKVLPFQEEEDSFMKYREEQGIVELEKQEEINREISEKMFKNRRISDHLNHLNFSSQWE